MTRQLLHYLKALRRFPSLSPAQRQRYLRRPHCDFTRRSPLSFQRTVTLVLSLMRKSTAMELANLFYQVGESTVTKSAFSQRRKLIHPQFFKDFFRLSVTQFYRSFRNFRTWRGLRVFAVDSSGQRLPDEDEVGDAFGWHSNQAATVASVHLLFTFDVLNKLIYRVDLHDQNQSEVRVAYKNVEKLPKEAIYIYDRAYANYGLPFLHCRHDSFYLIRIKNKQSPAVVDFLQSKEKEQVITVVLQGRAYHTIRKMGLNPKWKATIKVRLIRVDLPDGKVAVLMTNMFDRKRFHYRRMCELYTKRWGLETAFFMLKSFLQLAVVSAYTQPGVEQDLWASFWFYNLNSTWEFTQYQAVQDRTKNRLYTYQLNRNMAAGLIKRWVPSLFLEATRKWRAKTTVLQEMLILHLEPKRKRPSRTRTRKFLRTQGRHIYESNYRPTM